MASGQIYDSDVNAHPSIPAYPGSSALIPGLYTVILSRPWRLASPYESGSS